ncbi:MULTISPECIES: hypothetical protein [unclassified Colwellia]|jgi:hypothetical protein|uniref:hypothetical protein n=1 Tax=unclassified Colwellia TaxID=196834 RepID=UPI0015F5BEB4|nr:MULTISPECIES: hypothetical protein [unclassified Colwellia]MBA6232193.1 hypothetical protein [Colwellia sp. MB02u-7]MBA6237109.1 hypothetical protein [Colwellia sp. MB02u-11]MBA6301627.1 hypothetical protein [Colwellia sp. MB3u-22]MBA6311514.1 hypothetical protein [Colwellia sp. MB3u-64]
MRKPLVTVKEIVEAGEFLENDKVIVNEYTLSKKIGKGRPKRLIDEWNKYISKRQFVSLDISNTLKSCDIHVLEPEVELLLDNLIENMNQQFKEIIINCDKKVQLMADKKVDVANNKFDLEIEGLSKTLDVREEFIDELELENEKLIDELECLKLIEAKQFEYDKTFIKLRGRLQSKSDLLAERQLRINELVKLNSILEETTNMAE